MVDSRDSYERAWMTPWAAAGATLEDFIMAAACGDWSCGLGQQRSRASRAPSGPVPSHAAAASRCAPPHRLVSS